MEQQVVCGNIGGWTRIILLVLTLPEEMNVQQMALVSVDPHVTMLDVILYCSPLKK